MTKIDESRELKPSRVPTSAKARSHWSHGHASHDQGQSPEYNSWQAMLARCRYVDRDKDKKHIGRGIRVCSRWAESFENFLSDMGPRPVGTSIDRINNDGDYEPSNCKWSTPIEQARNRRNTKLNFDAAVEIAILMFRGGKSVDIARQYGISESLPREIAKGRTWKDAAEKAKEAELGKMLPKRQKRLSMEIKLKNCPFCGGSAKLTNEEFGWPTVTCMGRGCAKLTAYKSVETVVRKWNTRTESARDGHGGAVGGYESWRATMEGARNGSEAAYFMARPTIDTDAARKIFCDGFERGFEGQADDQLKYRKMAKAPAHPSDDSRRGDAVANIQIHETCCCGECKPNERTIGVVSKEEYRQIFNLWQFEKKRNESNAAEKAEPVAWAIGNEQGNVNWLSATYTMKSVAQSHIDSYAGEYGLTLVPLYAHATPRGADASPKITADELAAFNRFCDTCEDCDAGGYDVPKSKMQRLARIGLIRWCGGSRYETTEFGDATRSAALSGQGG